jgi:CheY-like chemotaxis protein
VEARVSGDRVVLIVDDDAALRESIYEALSDEGFHPVCAADGREALAWLERAGARPCIILLDLMMPNMNGWEFRREQLARPELARICTAIMTANQNADVDAIAAEHFLRKPVRLDRLLSVVEDCCARSR